MIAFDTDVLTEILGGNVLFVERAVKIPRASRRSRLWWLKRSFAAGSTRSGKQRPEEVGWLSPEHMNCSSSL